MPRRRTILTVCLLLVAGAIVNIAAAWVLVGRPAAPRRERVEFFNGEEGVDLVQHEVGWPRDWPAPDLLLANSVLGRKTSVARVDKDDVFRVQAGWPLHSVRFDGIKRSLENWQPTSASLEAPAILRRNGWFTRPHDRLPLTPLHAGFAINTLFYAAILALPMSVFPVRRRLRARRGRCPTCGYDRAGLKGDCPECGARS
jgi:hypothetical protein